jgi:predicted metal-binding membrane protein
MVVAMMLPTFLPHVLRFHRLVYSRRDSAWLLCLLLAGYAGVWTLFCACAHLAHQALHEALQDAPIQVPLPLLPFRADWIISSVTLIVAGAYQFAPLKRLCIEVACSPSAGLHDEAGSARGWAKRAWLLGLREGVLCVGCCWALMLIMFAGVTDSFVSMLLLGPVMVAERNTWAGRRSIKSMGAFLVGAGIMLCWGWLTGIY